MLMSCLTKLGKFLDALGKSRKITNSFLAGLMIFSGMGPASPSIPDSKPAIEENISPVAAGGVFGFRKLLAEDGVVLENGVLYNFFSSHRTIESFERISSLSGYEASEQTDISKNKDGSVIAVFDPDTKKGGIWSSFSTIYLNPSDYHFSSSSSLKNIDLTGFNASKLPDLSGWFSGSYNLEQVNLSGVDASNATGMSGAFSGLSKLKTVNMSGMNIRSVESMDSIFAGDKSLTSVAFSDVDARSLTRMRGVFSNADSLKLVDFSGADLSNVTDMSGMFAGSGFESIPEIKTDKVKIGQNVDMSRMFQGCSKLTEVDLSGRSFPAAAKLDGIFSGCSSLVSVNFSSVDISNATNLGYPFDRCSNLKNVNFSGIKAGKVIDFDNRAFYGARALETVDLSNADFRSLSSMQYMFNGDSQLKTVNLSGMKLGKTNMNNMFGGSSVRFVDMSGMDARMVTDMGLMFITCKNLASVKFTDMKIRDLKDVSAMFNGCSNLSALDLSSWEGEDISDFSSMFYHCSSLKSVDLSGLNTSKATSMRQMFLEDPNLSEIYVGPGWNTDNVTSSDNMFLGCAKLPNFDASAIDKTYANALPDGYLIMSNPNLRYLEKSSFVLSGTSDYGTAVNTIVTSNKSGRMFFRNLEKGTYTLTEVSPTDGYIKNSVKYTVTVTDSGVSVTPDNADYYYETSDQKVLFNEAYHAFTIQKTSSTDSTIGVAGAEFLLSGVSDYGTEVSQTKTTGSTGIATFDRLEAGNYLLTETKAPEHYALDPIPRVVSINKYGVVKIDGLSKEGSSFLWTDIRNADGTVTITKKWNDTLTGTNASSRALPSIVISTQRTIPEAVTVTYYAGDGYFGTDQTNKTNRVSYSEAVDQNGNVLSVSVSKGQEMTPSISGKNFDAWYLDSALTKKAPDAIADYIKTNPNVQTISLYAKYKDPPMLTTGKEFNAAIKTLAAGTSKSYTNTDNLIQSVQVVDTRPSGSITTKDVSTNNDGSYLAWWDAGTSTIKLYSESGDVILNPDSSSMFRNCTKLTTLDFSGWDTSQVTNMSMMFYNCSSLITLNVPNWNTSKVTDMSWMFRDCSKLTTLNVSNWNTSQVTNMSYMFSGCSKLTALDVSGWNTSQVTGMGAMFEDCSKLATLDVSNWNTSQVTDMSYMFSWCRNLTTLDVSKWNTSQVKNMSTMFASCSNLTTLDVSNWNTSKVANMNGMFNSCYSLTTLDVSNWGTSQVTSMSSMFDSCKKLTTLDISEWDTSQVTTMSGIFGGCSSLTTLNVSNWNTSQVTSMSSMFDSCKKLTTLDISEWDTSQVTTMSWMFNSCQSLTTLDVSKWDTGKVTNMSYMFGSCRSLTTIYIGSRWNTDKVTNSGNMFYYCYNLPNFNSSVVDKTKAYAGARGYMTLKS